MKKSLNKILLLLILSVITFNLKAQSVPQDSVNKKYTANQMLHKLAYNYMNGVNTDVDYNKAKRIYKMLASKQDAQAMNALGLMYKNGLGVTQSNDSARIYFEQGAELNHPKALLNLGLMYKNGDGVIQDFSKSFDYFNKALEKGNSGAYYALGYFYYKGLGVDQNYAKGLEYFKAGADVGIPPCMYMNGYCHLKGYGVPQDTVTGKQWINKASQKGYDRAVDFITENKINHELKGPTKKALSSTEAESFVPQKLTEKEKNRKDKLSKENIKGLWVGKLINYDWSGNKIVGEQRVSLYLDTDGTTLTGSWMQDDTISIRIEGSKSDSSWVFTNSKYEKENRRSWQIQQGNFELMEKGNKEYLKGNIIKYNLTIKEPSKPQYIVLERVKPNYRSASIGVEEDLTVNKSSIQVSPNPFSQELTVKLTLAKAQTGSIEIIDQTSRKVFSTGEIVFAEGVTSKQLSLSLVSGTYTIRFNGILVQLSTLIIKK